MFKRIFILAVMLLTTSAFAKDYIKGEVEEIISGDTFIVETKHGDVKVKLYGVEAPEKNQEYGRESRKLLGDLIDDEDVKIIPVHATKSGTLIGKVYLDGDYINAAMIKAGAAWYDDDHADDSKLEKAEKWARKHEVGIWSHRDPTPPWKYKKDHHIIDDDYDYDDSRDFSLNINIFGNDRDDHHKPHRDPHDDRDHHRDHH